MSASAVASAIFGAWFDASGDGAFAVDRGTGRLRCANRCFAELLGTSVEALVDASLASLLLEPDAAPELLARPQRHHDVAFRSAVGPPTYITFTSASMVQLGFGEVIACVGHDCSARVTAERAARADHAELTRAHAELAQLVRELSDAKVQLEDRNEELAALGGRVSRASWREAVGEMVGGIAHHLNNPLGALTSVQRRMEARLETVADPLLRADLRQLAARGREVIARIEANVGAVVRTQQLGVGEVAALALDLPHELEGALAMEIHRLGQVMVVRDYDRGPPVTVPRDALHVVLSHLLDNSLRAMNERGQLHIAVRQREDHVAVRLTDTGGGVPLELRPRLFEPILSARAHGAGLGLSTAQRLTRAWGGELSYAPVAGGSVFEIRIPCHLSAAREPRGVALMSVARTPEAS